MKLLTNLFINPEKLKSKNQKKIYKLLYEFSESSETSRLFLSDKTFRTITFWKNIDEAIPQLFQEWLENKGIKITRENKKFQVLGNYFEWKMTVYNLDEFSNYFIGYQFRLNPFSDVDNKPYKYEIHHLVIEIEKEYPKNMGKIYYDHTKQEIKGISLVEKISFQDLDEIIIQKALKFKLKFRKEIELKQYVLRTSMAKYNPLIINIRREVEIHFRKIAESSLEELAQKNITVSGIPFKDKLDNEAEYLGQTLYDDYDLYVNHLEKRDLQQAIQSVKNEIITKYLKP